MSIYLGTTPIAVNSSSREIGEIIQSTIPLSDAGLHLLDGAVINGAGSYAKFVNYIAGLYSENETAWTQPVLTSNGTLGGNKFAVYASNNYDASAYPIYMSFDNNSSTIWYDSATPVDVIFYNPKPLKVTNIQCQNRTDASNYAFTAGTVYGSNDNVTYTEISTFTNNDTSQGGTWNINLSNNTNFYLYYKVSFSSATQAGAGANFTITATYLDTPNYFITEEGWQSSVSTYGVCGKFVYDSVNNTVRLPKITGFTEGTISPITLGDLVEAGLPNITGSVSLITGANDMFDYGAFYKNTANLAAGIYGNSSGTNAINSFDASRSSSIYGNSDTVQPQSIKVLYYIVIANSVKTNIEVDIDEVMTDLNGKADVDLTNVNSSGTALASGWAMPSSRYIDLTLGASGATYTAPANGWVVARTDGNGGYVYLINTTSLVEQGNDTPSANIPRAALIPVRKNNVFGFFYNTTITTLRFIYAEGEENV